MTDTSPLSLRVAIVGAGPAGGLIRYGVAPDHPRITGIMNSLHAMLSAAAGRLPARAVDGDVLELLDEREVAYTTWDGWLAVDAHERELGASHVHTRERVKVVPRDEQVQISRTQSLALS